IIVSPAEVYDRCFNNRPEQKIPDITISCQVAADLIGATQQFISAAAKSGYLAGQVGPRNSALTLAGVRDFLRLYVLPDELGELLGEAKFGAGLRLQRDHVTPAVIINRCRVWLRSDVECWLQSQPEPYQS
ncbi:hypothetical protein, partial [Phenylobacterium sp.]|uniref:hypothetical protein n=1 Tax=Phenylobacterium sp. TaxID=1871053 RepID=UPI002F419F8B